MFHDAITLGVVIVAVITDIMFLGDLGYISQPVFTHIPITVSHVLVPTLDYTYNLVSLA